jgi:hypothetical protein
MPGSKMLNLGDLAPYLTPYQGPPVLDLSGVANLISHNRDRTQGREIADQQLGQQQAVLAEQKRQALASEAERAEAERARVAEAHAKLRRDKFAAIPTTTDPATQQAFEAGLPEAGLQVMPGMEYFGAPQTALPSAPKELSDPGMPPPGLEMPGLDMGAGYQPIDLSFQQKGSLTDTSTGMPVADYDPSRARDRQRTALREQMGQLAQNATDISRPAYEQAEAGQEGALIASGYRAGPAADALVKDIAKPEAQQLNANWRAQNQAVVTGERTGGTASRQWWEKGAAAAERTLATGAVADSAATYKTLRATVEEMASDPSPQATARGMFALARSNNPLEKRMSDQDFRASQGGQSLLDMSESQLETWFSGDQGAARRAAIIKALAGRTQQMLAEGKASYLKMARQRDMLPNEDARRGYHQTMARFADYGPDFYQALSEEDQSRPRDMGVGDGGGASGSSSYSRREAGGGVQLPDDGDEWETLP